MSQSKISENKSDEPQGACARPQARADGLVVREVADEVLVYDLERHRAVCLNRTAALVWRACDGRADVSGLGRALRAELPAAASAAATEDVVWLALEQLGREHLLRERVRRNAAPSASTSKLKSAGTSRTARGAGMSRRELMRALGVAAAFALPVVTAIVAPTAAQAVSCLPTGAACSTSSQCCSGTCAVTACL